MNGIRASRAEFLSREFSDVYRPIVHSESELRDAGRFKRRGEARREKTEIPKVRDERSSASAILLLIRAVRSLTRTFTRVECQVRLFEASRFREVLMYSARDHASRRGSEARVGRCDATCVHACVRSRDTLTQR